MLVSVVIVIIHHHSENIGVREGGLEIMDLKGVWVSLKKGYRHRVYRIVYHRKGSFTIVAGISICCSPARPGEVKTVVDPRLLSNTISSTNYEINTPCGLSDTRDDEAQCFCIKHDIYDFTGLFTSMAWPGLVTQLKCRRNAHTFLL